MRTHGKASQARPGQEPQQGGQTTRGGEQKGPDRAAKQGRANRLRAPRAGEVRCMARAPDHPRRAIAIDTMTQADTIVPPHLTRPKVPKAAAQPHPLAPPTARPTPQCRKTTIPGSRPELPPRRPRQVRAVPRPTAQSNPEGPPESGPEHPKDTATREGAEPPKPSPEPQPTALHPATPENAT